MVFLALRIGTYLHCVLATKYSKRNKLIEINILFKEVASVTAINFD